MIPLFLVCVNNNQTKNKKKLLFFLFFLSLVRVAVVRVRNVVVIVLANIVSSVEIARCDARVVGVAFRLLLRLRVLIVVRELLVKEDVVAARVLAELARVGDVNVLGYFASALQRASLVGRVLENDVGLLVLEVS